MTAMITNDAVVLGLLLLVLTSEWILRKLSELK